MNVAKIINIISMILNLLLVLGEISKAINTQIDFKNPIIPQDLMYNILFQDILKSIVIFCIFLFQLKLYKKQEYLSSILLYFIAVFIYNLRYFFL
ncbi:hypothetical protein NU10_09425 [Flavobacterium dauae]|uniref:hypothetical protein n=1 Tax=Flavobacterium dauae TaxID=1563479 RepID=UPI00101D762C|nr:hypothetical protein [Flavobacterium dauae]WLD22940.1 hypothetical protein NU10_09425 [Flavobacterium dauae]